MSSLERENAADEAEERAECIASIRHCIDELMGAGFSMGQIAEAVEMDEKVLAEIYGGDCGAYRNFQLLFFRVRMEDLLSDFKEREL